MKKAIGGLLVVSMLTLPHAIDLSYMTYLAFKSNNRVIVHYINTYDTKPDDINQVMAGLEINSRMIENLLKERVATLGRLETRMDLMRHAKVALTDEQMTGYARFMSEYHADAREFGELLKDIEQAKPLNAAQREILDANTDYSLVVEELGTVIDMQTRAINNLTRTICEGERYIDTLL